MSTEHSVISVSELESSPEIQLDKGKRPADPLANQFNPSMAETSTHPYQRNKILADEDEDEDEDVDESIYSLEKRLTERLGVESQGRNGSSISIYKFPPKLEFGSLFVQEPEIVSIGPYHRGKNHLLEFEDHKVTFLDEFLSKSTESLGYHLKKMKQLEWSARQCYQQESKMSSHDFVEMMLLDGCFIIVLLYLLGHGKADTREKNFDFIFAVPWRIPVLNQDLLKMENQLPFPILNYLFPFYKVDESDKKYQPLPIFALTVIGLSFPMPLDTEGDVDQTPLHLLELVYRSLLPLKGDGNQTPLHLFELVDRSLLRLERTFGVDNQYHPSNQPIQSVTRLRLSGIKFSSNRNPTTSFLDVKYKRLRRVLEIPTITISEYTKCLLINCVAWEQCHEYQSRTFSYFTDYIAFMNVLISEPRDVESLCADGIISNFSQGDRAVVDWLTDFQGHIAFNNRNSYLSDELKKLEVDFNSNEAHIRRTYFSSPWSLLSALTALLLIVCSLIQSVMSIVIVSYKVNPK